MKDHLPESAFAAYEDRMRDLAVKNQNLALRTDSTVIARTKGQLLRRDFKLCMGRADYLAGRFAPGRE